ncbi:DUF3048 domain-containing protein [Planococcus sp. YIM B11945]|uniref:DUF3048 domain-containing protein n=1 Tax=Planococcus sp. YIM B11945 TaxID=3435410 RepID=UPI003D7E6140
MKKWIGIIVILMLAAGALVYWLMNKEPEEATPEQPPTEEPEVFVSPFSGEQAEEPFEARPVMAVINNHPDARPQTGLVEADIVFEFLAEGNVTRFLALYQSKFPEEMGPIRSARDYFVEMAASYDAFFVAHGFSPDARSLLDSGEVDHINGIFYDGTLFQRSTDRVAPHNSYIMYDNVRAGMEQVEADADFSGNSTYQFNEADERAKLEEQASRIEVRYGANPQFYSVFTYDENTGQYNRASGGEETKDKESGEAVAVSNVLVLEATHDTIDAEGRLSIDLESGGSALVFQNGGVMETQWSNLGGMLVPTNNGEAIELDPGKTWIHIVPSIGEMVDYTP